MATDFISRVVCLRYDCGETASITCSTCNIVRYSSENCMQKDIPGHNIICNADYSQMLRVYSEHMKKPRFSFTEAYLSHYTRTKIHDDYYQVGFSRGFFCICCKGQGLINKDDTHDNGDVLLEIDVRNDGHECGVYYGRCGECYDQVVKICPVSYDVDKLCWRGTISLMILREYMVSDNVVIGGMPIDILSYILGIISNVSCYKHMFM